MALPGAKALGGLLEAIPQIAAELGDLSF